MPDFHENAGHEICEQARTEYAVVPENALDKYPGGHSFESLSEHRLLSLKLFVATSQILG
jgi:hypothetical protein